MYFAQELQPGFGAALLALLQSCGEALLAQAAAIYLKNFLQRRWQSLEDLTVGRWMGPKKASDRAEGRHVEMSRQARCFAEVLGPMHLELWRLACDRVVSDIPGTLRMSIELLLAATQVLFDLSRLVMVDQVQENLQTYMQAKRHDKETCEFVVTCIQRVLRETVADPRSAAICKHACIHLVISMAGSTGGQSIQSPGGLATEFFKEQLGPELLAVQAPPQGTSVEAVLFKAACLKFLTVLRNILPAELMLGVLPVLPLLLQAEHPLLHSYAAICANVLTTVQERVHEPGALPLWRPRYRREQLGPMLLQMIPTMLQILVEGRSIPKNTHLIRALLAWLNFLGPTVPPELVVKILQSLTQLVRALPSSGSGHAEFVHLLFGSLALALKAHSTAGSTAVVFPMVEQLWVSQVEDLLPYCYQIMGLMLDLGHSPVPLYGELLPKILAPDLWQAPGKVPGLVRLLRAFFAKVDFFRSVLQPAMGEIFARFQQALGNRQSASAAVGLLCAAFRFLPFELYCNHFQAALEACLTRLEGIKAPELEKDPHPRKGCFTGWAFPSSQKNEVHKM
eukprot:g23632.t1